jgi:hypothetical protein
LSFKDLVGDVSLAGFATLPAEVFAGLGVTDFFADGLATGFAETFAFDFSVLLVDFLSTTDFTTDFALALGCSFLESDFVVAGRFS